MIEKFKGIILKLADFNDADKLATIFSLEEGVLHAKFTGVKRDKAKFKAVAQPFVFANFVVVQKGKNLTITQADILETFPNILSNYAKTICAYIVLDMVASIIPAQKREEELFLLTLNALKQIETQNEYLSTIAYVLNFLKFSGLELQFVNADAAFLDTYTGNFVPQKQENSLLIDKKVYSILKQANEQISNPPAANPPQSNENTQKQALRLLHNIIYLKLGTDVKSFQFI